MKISVIYLEKDLQHTEAAQRVLSRFSGTEVILINHYGEVFNRKGQNFRLQKRLPSLFIAKKVGKILHPIPKNYSLGNPHNYYFSHVLNCPFDCKYCFLQGMYNSADYVYFVNMQDFTSAIEEKIKEHSGEKITFFSGYDGDSLALEPITHFLHSILPLFEKHKEPELEIRTKSIAIAPLLKREPLQNVISAFTLSPDPIAKALEIKAPPLSKRLEALVKLQKAGWPIGLRFDPLIDCKDAKKLYAKFFEQVFSTLNIATIHSITMGLFRLPPNVEKRMRTLLPSEPILAREHKKELLAICYEIVTKYIPKEKVFLCEELSSSPEPALVSVKLLQSCS